MFGVIKSRKTESVALSNVFDSEIKRNSRVSETRTARSTDQLTETKKGKHFGAGEEWKKCCPCIKQAESPRFFQLWAAANSAHSKVAYGNKTSWEITAGATGIFNPSSSSRLLLSFSNHTPFSSFSLRVTLTLDSPKFKKKKRKKKTCVPVVICFFLTKKSSFANWFLFLLQMPKQSTYKVSPLWSETCPPRVLHAPTSFYTTPSAGCQACHSLAVTMVMSAVPKHRQDRKISSLRQEAAAELWQPNPAWQHRPEPSHGVCVCLIRSLEAFIPQKILIQ